MKKLLIIPLLLISNLAISGPYLMSKHEFKMNIQITIKQLIILVKIN